MGATGESVVRVSDFGFNPAWSPDGKEVVVSSQPVWGNPYTILPIGELWRIEVASGLKAGDRVALTDVDKLVDGMKVTATKQGE